MDKRIAYVGVLLFIVFAASVLLIPQSSPKNELPTVSEPPLQRTDNTDVRQVINMTYYAEGDRTIINDTIVYDGDTQRGYSVVTEAQVNEGETIDANKNKRKFYIEPAPAKNGVRLYMWDTSDTYPTEESQAGLKKIAANDSTYDVAFSKEGELYKYRFFNYTYFTNNSTISDIFSERTLGSTAYPAYTAINQNSDTLATSSHIASPNYTVDGETVTRNGIVYQRYTAHNSWRTQSGETTISAYDASGTVLYNETVGFGYANVSYDSVSGNTRLAKIVQEGTIAIDNLLPESIKTETEGRTGIDVRYNATIKNGTVSGNDVPCPAWTERVGPTPSCRNETTE